jgi:hypothetical protein
MNTPRSLLARLALVAATLLAATAGAGTLRPLENAYELGVRQVQLPPGDTGPLVVRPCGRCPPVTLAVGPDTTWHLAPMAAASPRGVFLQAFGKASLDADAFVYVLYRPGTREVTRVILDRPAAAAEPRP